MHLSALELRQFRSHSKFTRRFDARPICIYGPNGAGKTNILEAISLLSPGRGLRGAAAEEMARRPEAIGWAVRGELASAEGPRRLAVSVDLRGGAKRKVDLDGSPATQSALGAVIRSLWLTPAMDRLWIEGASERRKFLDRTTLAFEPKHAERSAAYERALRERNRLLKEPSPPPAWFNALEERMATAGLGILQARRQAISRLQNAQEHAKTLFPKAEIAILGEVEEFFGTTDKSADVTAPAENEKEQYTRLLRDYRSRDMAAGRTLLGPHRSDLGAIFSAKGVEARYCSTGEQKALLISLVLSTARSLRNDIGAAPILLLDEVAAHLDHERRAALYDEISALGAQAWMTGTGPELFNTLGASAQRIVFDAEGATPETTDTP
ncbi:MAG: DNA replication/repair protein RecF [Rhodobacteraceae bacterium]|nr:DNA replication/repair protein RecF [Paracoccaceae bacterium]